MARWAGLGEDSGPGCSFKGGDEGMYEFPMS